MKIRHDNISISIPVLLVISGVTYLALNPIVQSKTDFFNELWGPAHLLIQGKSPYNTSGLNPELPAVWLPMAIGVFSPLGLVSEPAAARIWFFFNIMEVSFIIWFATRKSPSNILLPAICLLVFFFPPTINHFTLGQFSITAMTCIILSTYFAGKGSDWLAAIFLALGLSKPQLGILAVFGLGIFFFKQGGFLQIIKFTNKILIAILFMSMPLFIAYTKWIPDWIASTQANHYAWRHPSLFFILKESLGNTGYLIWGLIAAATLLICYQMWTNSSPQIAMYWSLGLTTIISPYIWSWDFVLLLPVLIHAFSEVGWRGKLFLFNIYLIGCLGMAVIQLSGNNNNYRFWWVPVWFIGMIALSTRPKPHN